MVSGNEKDLYTYRGTFTPNDQIKGTWGWAIWPRPKTEQELPALAAKFAESAKPPWKSTVQFLDGGAIKSKEFSSHFWSGDMLISLYGDVAQKMEVKKFGGRDFLIMETDACFGKAPTTESEDDSEQKKEEIPYPEKYTFYMKISDK